MITGPSQGGIGAQTVIELAHASPSTIILLGRSLSRIQPTIDTITSISPSIRTAFIPVDLSSLSSVRSAAQMILEDTSIEKIDVLINNAAIMACPYKKSEDGLELQLATNHLSHFLLSNLLLPKIQAAGQGARIICVSSWAHFMSPVLFSDPGFSSGKSYSPWIAYGQAKTAIILFAVELNRRLAGQGIKAFALHPGSIKSNLQQYMSTDVVKEAQEIWRGLGKEDPVLKSVEQGCATTLRAALDPALEKEKGVFLQDCQLSEEETVVAAFAVDEGNARRCWEMSEEMVGEKFEV